MSAASAFLRDMDFTDVRQIKHLTVCLELINQIRFLGGKLGNAIATEYGAKTVGDLLWEMLYTRTPLSLMRNAVPYPLRKCRIASGKNRYGCIILSEVSITRRVSRILLFILLGTKLT